MGELEKQVTIEGLTLESIDPGKVDPANATSKQRKQGTVRIPTFREVVEALQKDVEDCSTEEKEAVKFFYKVPLASMEGSVFNGKREGLTHSSLLQYLQVNRWSSSMAYALVLLEFYSDQENIVDRFKELELKKERQEEKEQENEKDDANAKKPTKGQAKKAKKKCFTAKRYEAMADFFHEQRGDFSLLVIWETTSSAEMIFDTPLAERRAKLHAWDKYVGLCGPNNDMDSAENRFSVAPEHREKRPRENDEAQRAYAEMLNGNGDILANPDYLQNMINSRQKRRASYL